MLSLQVESFIPIIIDFLKGQPVMKAWLFGSCSRGEESIDSDIDLLVEYDYDAGASLMTASEIRISLKKLLIREIDIVEKGCLLPFAVTSVERDKILIHERGNK